MGVIHIGIDPGVTGALCMLTPAPDWRCEVIDLPAYEVQGKLRKKKHVDAVKLQQAMRALVPKGLPVLVTIEDVMTISGMNTSSFSSDSLVESRVTCENVARMLGFTIQRVRPQTWQRFFGLKGGDKKLSIGTAQRLYPMAPITLAKHHNRSEAVLLAHYARRNHIEALSAQGQKT